MSEWKCQTVFENLSNYLDGDLSDSDKKDFERHIVSCEKCDQFGEEFFRVVEALRKSPSFQSEEREAKIVERILAG